MGLLYLRAQDKAEIVGIATASIHRNTEFVLGNIRELVGEVDVIIAGAGCANHLTGMVDAYLRYALKVVKPIVVGVAFEDANNPTHTKTAIASIRDVPGTQVVFDDFIGEEGFLKACEFAAEGNLPAIELKKPKSTRVRTLDEAIERSKQT